MKVDFLPAGRVDTTGFLFFLSCKSVALATKCAQLNRHATYASVAAIAHTCDRIVSLASDT